jgi:predicted  nucleic acid-binding Zn-ribbon protein
MAASTPEELQKNFEKLQRLANQLGKDFSSFNLRAITDDAETVKELLSAWQTELNDSRESLDSITSSFRDVVQQISKSNIGLNATKSSFKKLSGLAEDISLHQSGINKLNKDDLQSIQSKIAKEKKLLELNISTL